MQQKVIEGTWEEVTRRGQELAGHRVRVTVLDDLALPEATNGTHADETTIPTAFDVLSREGRVAEAVDAPRPHGARAPIP